MLYAINGIATDLDWLDEIKIRDRWIIEGINGCKSIIRDNTNRIIIRHYNGYFKISNYESCRNVHKDGRPRTFFYKVGESVCINQHFSPDNYGEALKLHILQQ